LPPYGQPAEHQPVTPIDEHGVPDEGADQSETDEGEVEVDGLVDQAGEMDRRGAARLRHLPQRIAMKIGRKIPGVPSSATSQKKDCRMSVAPTVASFSKKRARKTETRTRSCRSRAERVATRVTW
jgi:hypothetical protein